ncbi:5'-nucleotidase C-terminal domain-containing protein [Desulfocicer niacini]
MSIIRKVYSLLSIVLIILLTTAQAVISAEKLTILSTNDHHGHFMANRNGEYGMAARMTLVEKIRREVESIGGHLLIFSGGDINTGTPESDFLKAEPDIKAMNLLGYTAMAVGNHEFDKGFTVLKQQMAWADFPFLSANIFWENNQEPAFTPYVIKQVGNLRVAIFGLSTPDTPIMTRRENVTGLIFKNPVPVAENLLQALKPQSDIIILVSHLGYYKKGKHGLEAPGDVSLASRVNGIDIIVGGHTHKALTAPCRINNTFIVQAGEWGKYLARTDLEYSPENGVVVKKYQLIPVNLEKNIYVAGTSDKSKQQPLLEKITPHAGMTALLAPYVSKVQERFNSRVGSVDGYFEGDRDVIRKQETNMGNLVSHAMATISNCDIAIQNSGGIRDSLAKGPVTFRDLIKINPFGNTIIQVTLTGRELKIYMKKVLSFPAGHGSFPQIQGICATLDGGKLVDLAVKGKPVVDTDFYKLALNNFIATGGDGYPDLSGHISYVDTGFTMDQAIINLFEQRKLVTTQEFQTQNCIKRSLH